MSCVEQSGIVCGVTVRYILTSRVPNQRSKALIHVLRLSEPRALLFCPCGEKSDDVTVDERNMDMEFW